MTSEADLLQFACTQRVRVLSGMELDIETEREREWERKGESDRVCRGQSARV